MVQILQFPLYKFLEINDFKAFLCVKMTSVIKNVIRPCKKWKKGAVGIFLQLAMVSTAACNAIQLLINIYRMIIIILRLKKGS